MFLNQCCFGVEGRVRLFRFVDLRVLFWLISRIGDVLQMILRFGFPWLAEDVVLRAASRPLNRGVIEKWEAFCSIDYSPIEIDGEELTRLIVTPKNVDCHPLDGVILFFQGAGICLEKTSCLVNMIDMALRCKKIVVGFNQRHVGSSRGYHYSANSLRMDLDKQSQWVLDYLSLLRCQGRVTHCAKMFVYGLCQGGVLAISSVRKIIDHPNFSKIIVTRAPVSFSDMIAFVPEGDYRTLMPKAYRQAYGLQKTFSISHLASPETIKAVITGQILRFLSLISPKRRSFLFGLLFRFSRWHMDCRPIIHKLVHHGKLFAISVDGDEFVSPEADIVYYVRQCYPALMNTCVMQAFSTVSISDAEMQCRSSESFAPFDTVSGLQEHLKRHVSEYYRHQSWSQHMRLPVDSDGGFWDEYEVIQQVMLNA